MRRIALRFVPVRSSLRRALPRIALAGLAAVALARPALAADPAGSAEDVPSGPDVRRMGALILDGIPEIPEELAEKMTQYQNVRQASFAAWAPDELGGLVISTRFGETAQIHHVATPLGARTQLTFFDEPVSSASFGRKPGWFLFNRDWGGNEASQIFRYDLRTGESTLLTDGEVQNGGPVWSNAKDRVAWRSTVRNGKDHDIWIMDPEQPEGRRLALEVEGYWYPTDWSPDDGRLIVGNYVSAAESYTWEVDLATGKKRPLARHDEVDGATISYGGMVYDRTGKGILFTSDEGTEFRTLRRGRVGSEDSEIVTRDIPWDVGGLATSRDRRSLAFSVNADGTDQLWVMDTDSGTLREIRLPLGVLGGYEFSPDGTKLAFTFETTASPGDVYTVDLATDETTRWTRSEVGGLDTSEFVESELIHFPTFDRTEDGKPRMIPAFLYRPEGEGPFPVIVRIHGGPESQSRAWFSYTSQYYVNELGCAVIYPNVRGSSGYGKTYLGLDNGFLREDSVKDIGALLDWIAERPDLDATRVGVTGGSYGGYMTLACLTHYSDRIRCGIDIVGISNFVTFLKNTADYRRDLRRVEYGDERDPAMYEHLLAISPTNSVDRIDVPLFVVQGANDPRVPRSEAEQIVAAVRAKGKEAWYMLAMDEGHGFAKKSNSDQMTFAMSLFWQRYLLDGEPALQRREGAEVPAGAR